jgi:radical SAM superfamily enzyme YgiQ (UPF0313 family)
MTKQLYLVNPPNPCDMKGFPGSLLALDLWARKKVPGVESTIIDEENTPEELLSGSLESKLVTAPENPFFGITSTTATYQDALTTAKALKKIRPNSTVVLGGHHVDGQENVILDAHSEIDLVVSGEGEKALESILKGDLDANGVAYRGRPYVIRGERLKQQNGKYNELDEIDAREFDDKFILQATQFGHQNLVTARGCPLQCAFCAVANSAVVAQSPELVIDEIDYIVTQNKMLGVQRPIAIQDNFFAQNPKRAKEIAEKLIAYRHKTGNEFEWNMQTRVEQFSKKDLVDLVAQAGCTEAYFGIENFDPRILKDIVKAANSSNYIITAQQAIDNCIRYGIIPNIDFQVGLPKENNETERINISALEEIGRKAHSSGGTPHVFPSLSVVYPATGFHQRMMAQGVPENVYEIFTKWERENPEYRSAIKGYFAHGNGGIPLGILKIDDLKEGKINIQHDKLQGIKSYVDRIRDIEGIKTHNYDE